MENNLPEVKLNILLQLLHVETARYNELKNQQTDVDPKLFFYHLQKLIEENFVEKVGSNYKLTPEGGFYAEAQRWTLNKTQRQPRVHAFVAYRKGRKFLVVKRKRQTYKGYIDLIGGKVELEYNTKEAAFLRCHEIAGMTPKDLQLFAVFGVRNKHDDKVIDNKLFFVYKAIGVEAIDMTNQTKGKLSWMSLNDIKTAKKVYPDIVPVLETYDSKSISYFDFTYYEPFEGKFESQKLN